MLHNKWAEDVAFLIQRFGLFGIEGQIWMLLGAFLIAVFAVAAWRTGGRIWAKLNSLLPASP
jgi:hypothetical protein